MSRPSIPLHGFSLIELLIVISILAILSAGALPSFAALSQSVSNRSARSALSVSINQARIGAVSRAQHVVACPSSDQVSCLDSVHWQHGWLVFVDANRNGLRDADETILSLAQAQPKGLAIISSNGRKRVRYLTDGSAEGSNLTLTFCDRRGARHARSLVINNSGRLRSGVASAEQAEFACAAVAR